MTLSGNYNHLQLGTAALAEQFHIQAGRQVTRTAGLPPRWMPAVASLSAPTNSLLWWLGLASSSSAR